MTFIGANEKDNAMLKMIGPASEILVRYQSSTSLDAKATHTKCIPLP